MSFKILLIISFLIAINCQASNKLLDALKAQAAKIATSLPADYNQLVVEIQTKGIDGYDACASDQFNTMIDKYGFSAEIVNNFRTITFSQSEEFQTFNVQIKQTYADIIEFIGAGANLGGTIQIAFLQVFSEGTPYPGKKFTPDQYATILQALRAFAYSKVEQFLETPPSRITNYKAREQYLLDQNAWAIKMTESGDCSIEAGSPCSDLLYDISYFKCNHFTSAQADDFYVCILENFPMSSYHQSCFLCLCAYMFYHTDPLYPKANQECFAKQYPGVTDIYDLIGKKKSLINIHFWNQTDQKN